MIKLRIKIIGIILIMICTLHSIVLASSSTTSLKNEQAENNKKINEMLELVEQKIDEAINSITNADFEINPKKSDKFSSCDKCIYNEICYRNEKDFVYLKEGEKNA